MSIKNKISSSMSSFSPLANKMKLHKVNKIWLIVGVASIFLFIIGVAVIKNHQHKVLEIQEEQTEKSAKFTSITTNFTDEDTRSELHAEQTSVDTVQNKYSELENKFKDLETKLNEAQKSEKQQQDIQAKTLTDLRTSMGGTLGKESASSSTNSSSHLTREQAESNLTALNNTSSAGLDPHNSGTVQPQLMGGIQHFSLNWDDQNSMIEEEGTVTSGTFARAVLLGGADANASVSAQSNTSPILIRILQDGEEANGKKAKLKGCIIVAEVYGDISSERGEVRLNRLSCNKEDGTVLDIPVKGTAFDIGGKEGIRGVPVMRNGKILFYSGLSGFAAGISNSAQNAQTSQSVNPLGNTTNVPPGKMFAFSAYGGLSNASSKMSQYYIDRAEQYHPIIQLNAGSIVDVVFLEGFSLKSSIKQSTEKPVTSGSQATIQQVLAQSNQTNQSDQNNGINNMDPINGQINSGVNAS